jgi:aminoglycoside 3-N-acetyltransferase
LAWTRARIQQQLHALGVAAGDLVMVHASLRAVGEIIGGPDEVHQAVVDAVSPGGAMMMYVACPVGYDDIGRGVLSAEEEAAFIADLPPFDSTRVRAARDFGALAEFFRSYSGTLPSANVGARMAARGDRAAWLVADHPLNYGYGIGTPMGKLVHAGGKVLLLGSDRDQVTLLHFAESVASFTGKRVVRYRTPLLIDGQRQLVPVEEFDTNDVHPNWPEHFFQQIVEAFIAEHGGSTTCRLGAVGGADSVLMDAAALVAFAVPQMVRVATP